MDIYVGARSSRSRRQRLKRLGFSISCGLILNNWYARKKKELFSPSVSLIWNLTKWIHVS
jgi:hypothetical protein